MGKFTKGLLFGLCIGLIISFSAMAFASQPIKLIINGQEIKCDVPPQNIGGRVLVPARYVAEPLGATVEWDGVKQEVRISSQKNENTLDTQLPKTETKQDSDKITSEQYQSFKNMFSVGQKIFHQSGGDLSCKATYNGNLSESDFFKYWNSMDLSTKEALVKKFGAEIQAINPSIDIAIDLWYKDMKLGYVLAYSNNTQICSLVKNPQMKQSDIKQ
ncbi:MAG TPA: copper amine oxidase N-terminal domain-containing protein [Syntrophomonadaceae bacterium]|nr:copper amine oxidase N-terminal domain-containing protein [Syntrophomonadaceae bacterium]HQE23677.1 copper amine oxidase N-terminal domain-containing protein [Syntrophomonadaceae bacterium]